MNRIAVALLTVVGVSSSAHAEVEVGGTAGLHIFSESNALGSPASNDVAEPVHQANSAMFGARLGFYFTSMLGVELEAGVIPTESTGPQGSVTFDIWDFTARANVIAQFRTENPENNIIPFVTLGGGFMRVVDIGTIDDSLWEKNDTKGLGFLGIGAKYRAGGGWGVRVDVRGFLVPAHGDSSVTTEAEILLGLYRAFGGVKKAEKPEPTKTTTTNDDPDNDGVTGEADKCPNEPEDKDGFQDEDGCPDPDNDSDGVPDTADKCPGEPEDKDNFQDDDGCPDPDNDADGVPDAADKCADQPETRNGFQDDDGCPDEVPAQLSAIMGPVAGVNFKVNSADLLPASNKALDKVAAVLAEVPDVHVEIQAHTDDQTPKGKFTDNDALSQARADAVKQYLVKKGVTEDRLVARGYAATTPVQDPTGLKGAKLAAARRANQRVELKLVTAGAEAPAPAATVPAAEQPKADTNATEPAKQ